MPIPLNLMKNLPLFTKKRPLTDILKNPLTDSLTSIYGTILPFLGSIVPLDCRDKENKLHKSDIYSSYGSI